MIGNGTRRRCRGKGRVCSSGGESRPRFRLATSWSVPRTQPTVARPAISGLLRPPQTVRSPQFERQGLQRRCSSWLVQVCTDLNPVAVEAPQQRTVLASPCPYPPSLPREGRERRARRRLVVEWRRRTRSGTDRMPHPPRRRIRRAVGKQCLLGYAGVEWQCRARPPDALPAAVRQTKRINQSACAAVFGKSWPRRSVLRDAQTAASRPSTRRPTVPGSGTDCR